MESNLPAGDFSRIEIERARSYRRPLYWAFAADLALSLAVLAVLAFTPAGGRLFAISSGLPWWAQALVYPALVLLVSALVRFPLALWRGYVRERRFGFSTQTPGGWLGDRVKATVVAIVLTSLALLGLIALARDLPGAWPAVAAPVAALLVVTLAFVSPLLLEPIFSRFRPLDDEVLAGSLHRLSEVAGVPVREVLVADASRRTTKANAYVSGLGRTRRVVLYDTLLRESGAPEIRLVTAHELAHRRERHVAKGTALGALGAAAFVLVVWLLLGSADVLAAIGATGPADPRIAPFVLLVAAALELLTMPFGAALSRRFERTADRVSLELTGDLPAFVAAHTTLARSNLSDLDPPRVAYVALFTHPTPPERLAAARLVRDLGPPAAGSDPA